MERPASVVKELLENCLDAGAQRIHIDVEEGGIRRIRVRDDGWGVHRDDLAEALRRHATSKIATLEELERVGSLGFRGEALPSIASVSRLSLTSRLEGDGQAWRMRVDGGESQNAPELANHPTGTTVDVCDLFFNTPGRRRFLRTTKTEYRHLEEAVRRIALSRDTVAVSLTHNGKQTLQAAAASDADGIARRFAAICGKGFAEVALFMEFEAGGLCLRGWMAPPEHTRSQADMQYFFVNGRSVRDRLLNHAVRQVLTDRVHPGRHPLFAFYLDMDAGDVDVNVHPAKAEVKFRESRGVHDFVATCVRRGLGEGGREFAPMPAVPWAVGGGSAVGENVRIYGNLHGPGPAGWSGSPASPVLAGPGVVLDGGIVVAQTERGLVLMDVPATRECLVARQLTKELSEDGVACLPLLVPEQLPFSASKADLLEELGESLTRLGFEFRRSGPESVQLRGIPAPLADASALAVFVAVTDALEQTGNRADLDAVLVPLLAREARCEDHQAGHDEVLRLLRRLDDEGIDPDQGCWTQVSADTLRKLIGTR